MQQPAWIAIRRPSPPGATQPISGVFHPMPLSRLSGARKMNS
jgi:hypothetical protein